MSPVKVPCKPAAPNLSSYPKRKNSKWAKRLIWKHSRRAAFRPVAIGRRSLRRAGQRIAAAGDKPEYKWELIQGKEINALALPGGKVAFWEGIIPVAQDDHGVAVIMGHEIAHALADHGAERASQQMGAQAISQILALGIGQVSPGMEDDFTVWARQSAC